MGTGYVWYLCVKCGAVSATAPCTECGNDDVYIFTQGIVKTDTKKEDCTGDCNKGCDHSCTDCNCDNPEKVLVFKTKDKEEGCSGNCGGCPDETTPIQKDGNVIHTSDTCEDCWFMFIYDNGGRSNWCGLKAKHIDDTSIKNCPSSKVIIK